MSLPTARLPAALEIPVMALHSTGVVCDLTLIKP